MPRALSLSFLMLLVSACTMQMAPESPKGVLALALTHDDAGTSYRLQGASLSLDGPTQQTLQPPADEMLLQLELASGDYTLTLQDGWQLEREDGATWTPVAADYVGEPSIAFTITAGEVTPVALRFVVLDDGGVVTLGTGTLEVSLQVEPCAPRLVINELDVDQDGTDVGDFVELLNAGSCPQPTEGLSLVLINGGSTDTPVYRSVALADAADVIESGERLLVGRSELVASGAPDALAIVIDTFALQNGPDGVRIEGPDGVIDAMSYGGDIVGSSEGTSAPDESGGTSLGRCPDGSDSDDNASDFVLLDTPTPGAPNC
jgi:hypothetical protein